MFMLMCEDGDDVVMWMFPVVFFIMTTVKMLPEKNLTSFRDINHSVARQCHTVARATQQVNGKWQFWGVRTP